MASLSRDPPCPPARVCAAHFDNAPSSLVGQVFEIARAEIDHLSRVVVKKDYARTSTSSLAPLPPLLLSFLSFATFPALLHAKTTRLLFKLTLNLLSFSLRLSDIAALHRDDTTLYSGISEFFYTYLSLSLSSAPRRYSFLDEASVLFEFAVSSPVTSQSNQTIPTCSTSRHTLSARPTGPVRTTTLRRSSPRGAQSGRTSTLEKLTCQSLSLSSFAGMFLSRGGPYLSMFVKGGH